MATYNNTLKPVPSQRQRVLTALRQAGEKGITNVELQEISLRWQARLQELYMQGYKVALENLGDGVYNYVLVHEPETIAPRPVRAQTILTREIEGKFGGTVTTAQLLHILASNGLQVGRKAGSFK
ncbi:hypothetical protein SECTIM467_128 [Brevibacillus phage SecTim467]|uniref:Uncharacterized protein n=2 Tax=Jenstvirus jenst TaxID=1982225 RepID=A0A0K2CPG3_9CAUD|nr:hypothetical protein AVV11_gp068 [Brevibacillus phage Jenst]ALA07252.1 hypothetical protein JENST_123 [Brevibacillus phage Jenst]ALA07454.1 hypothetical protein SECTIM467_128 [Brevibacillus phage SecTim467]